MMNSDPRKDLWLLAAQLVLATLHVGLLFLQPGGEGAEAGT